MGSSAGDETLHDHDQVEGKEKKRKPILGMIGSDLDRMADTSYDWGNDRRRGLYAYEYSICT